SVAGILDEDTCRRLMRCYVADPDRAFIFRVLRDLRQRSMLLIDDDELRQLETFARRIRGEIFFARRWLIVEGQSEYLLLHALGKQLDYDLDEHGVSVIDAVNNGHPATFVALARALGIPWIALLDGDEEGHRYVTSIGKRGVPPAVLSERCKTHPAGK